MLTVQYAMMVCGVLHVNGNIKEKKRKKSPINIDALHYMSHCE